MAQYESLAAERSPKFVPKCCISYAKMLLIPSGLLLPCIFKRHEELQTNAPFFLLHCNLEIWKFGFIDGLAIDERMKTFWGKISKSGGAGSNPETEAIKGYVRMLNLLPTRMTLRDESRHKQIFLHFSLTPSFEYHAPVAFHLSTQHNYAAALKYMFAGDIGSEMQRACQSFDVATSHVRSVCHHHCHHHYNHHTTIVTVIITVTSSGAWM